jgi:hypothetical protein
MPHPYSEDCNCDLCNKKWQKAVDKAVKRGEAKPKKK